MNNDKRKKEKKGQKSTRRRISAWSNASVMTGKLLLTQM